MFYSGRIPEYSTTVLYIDKFLTDISFKFFAQVAYQNILQLSYVDKFLTDIQLEFRERYKSVLLSNMHMADFRDFDPVFRVLLKDREAESKVEQKVGR